MRWKREKKRETIKGKKWTNLKLNLKLSSPRMLLFSAFSLVLIKLRVQIKNFKLKRFTFFHLRVWIFNFGHFFLVWKVKRDSDFKVEGFFLSQSNDIHISIYLFLKSLQDHITNDARLHQHNHYLDTFTNAIYLASNCYFNSLTQMLWLSENYFQQINTIWWINHCLLFGHQINISSYFCIR